MLMKKGLKERVLETEAQIQMRSEALWERAEKGDVEHMKW